MGILDKFDKFTGIKRSNFGECIGIFISLTDVYVAQVSENSGGIDVDSLIKLPVGEISPELLKPADLNEGFFSSPKHWLDPIQKIIESRDWKTKNVVVSLSSDFCIHRHFVMQDIARSYWKHTIPLQARKYIHYPFERGVFDYYVYPFYASLSKTKKLGVVFSMTSSRIISVLEAGMKRIGLNLVSVESSPVSVYRLFSQVDKENIDGKGCIYSNFNSHEGQFLFALNNVPVLVRRVEVQRAMGSRNHLEVTNCMDFISKQLEKNPFEDVVVISDDGDFWAPILEGEVKRHVRQNKVSEIFGFRVDDFAEMAVLGACLKFVNKKVPDVDFYRENRSSDEEIRATTAAWQIIAIFCALVILYGVWTQVRSMTTMATLKFSRQAREEVADFKGLYASQIKEKVSSLKANNQRLDSLLVSGDYTKKLSALPGIVPEDIWLTGLSIKYPYGLGQQKDKNALYLDGVASAIEGSSKELALGNQFNSAMSSSPEMSDLCKNLAAIEYNLEGSFKGQGKSFVLGTKFSIRCVKDKKD